MPIKDELDKRIEEEIKNDPDRLGYEGKTDEEIMTLLTTPVRKERIVYDYLPPPMDRILRGAASTPSVVTIEEVAPITKKIKDDKK